MSSSITVSNNNTLVVCFSILKDAVSLPSQFNSSVVVMLQGTGQLWVYFNSYMYHYHLFNLYVRGSSWESFTFFYWTHRSLLTPLLAGSPQFVLSCTPPMCRYTALRYQPFRKCTSYWPQRKDCLLHPFLN